MIKLKNSIGILTILAAISLVTLGFVMMSQNVAVSATLVKISIFNFCLLIALSGLFIVRQFCEPQPLMQKLLLIFAIVIILFGGLAAFNIIDIHQTWNLLIGLSVLYVTLIQMQILNWSKSKQLLKVIGLLTFVSNIYIFTFFVFKISSAQAGLILDIAVLTSIISFLVGLLITRKKAVQEA